MRINTACIIGTDTLYDHRGYSVTGRPVIMLTKFPALQSDNHSDAKQDRSPHRFLAWRVFVTGAGRYSAILLRRRANGLLELFDSLPVEEIPGMTAGFAANYLTGTWCASLLVVSPVPGSSVASHQQSPGRLRINRYGTVPDLSLPGGHVGLIALTLCSAFMSIQTQQSSRWALRISARTPNTVRLHRYDHYWRRYCHSGHGFCRDAAGNIPTAELIPALCFAVSLSLPVSVLKRQLTEHIFRISEESVMKKISLPKIGIRPVMTVVAWVFVSRLKNKQ